MMHYLLIHSVDNLSTFDVYKKFWFSEQNRMIGSQPLVFVDACRIVYALGILELLPCRVGSQGVYLDP